MKVSAESSSPGRSLSTCRSRKHGLSFSRNAACSGESSIARAGVPALERQPALVAGAEAPLVEELLGRDRRHPAALQRQKGLDPVAAVSRVRQRQLLDPLHHLGRRGHRVRLGDRRQVLQPVQPMGLEAPLPVVEAGAVDATPAAGLGDVAQPLRQLQDRQPPVRQLLVGVLRRQLACRLRHRPSSPPAAWTSPGRKTRRLRRHLIIVLRLVRRPTSSNSCCPGTRASG